MAGVKYSRKTFMDAQDKTQKGMLFDILEGLDNRLDNICKLPEKCEIKMDEKIETANKTERKRRNRINIGLGGGSGVGAVGIWELFKAWISNG